MQITEKQYNLIQKFMRNELSDSEKLEFENNSQNKNFRDELLVQAEILNALESGQNQKLKEFFKQVDSEMNTSGGAKIVELQKNTATKTDTKQKSGFSRNILKYAAVLTILLCSVFVAQNYLGTDQSELFASYYKPYDSNVMRGQGSEMKSFNDALFSYSSEEYAEADAEFSKLSDVSTDALFFGSICKLELGLYDNAISGFSKIKDQDSKYSEDAEWYLAMTYLKKGENAKLESLLEEMSSENSHAYSDRAKNLLTDLK